MTEEDKGRQVPYHRSGGGMRVAGAGRGGLALAAMLAMTAAMPGLPVLEVRRSREDTPLWPMKPEPDDRGRRAEKDSIALAKAEAKRRRKAAKRAKTQNAEITGSALLRSPG